MNLLFDEKKIKELKETTDKDLQKMIGVIMDKAEGALEIAEIDEGFADDNEHLLKKQAQHGNYYEASKPFCENMPILGFAYHYSGDVKYFKKAKKLMMLYASYKKWYGSGFFAKSELNNSHFNFGMACGYDMFYDALTEEERKIILTATYEKGIKPTVDDWICPETRVHAMDTMGHNWWVVCISMAGIAALVMKRDMPELDKAYRMAAEAVGKWFLYKGNSFNMKPVNFDKGGYYEGISYLDFSLREYGLFKMAAKRLIGEDVFDDAQILKQCSEFFAHVAYPNENDLKHIYFGDADLRNPLTSPKILLAAGAELPIMRWYISKQTDSKVTIYDILFYNEIYKGDKHCPETTDIIYDKIGWAVFRNSFEDNASVLAVKCGDTWNHAHADAASFIYYDGGREIVGEGGTCAYGEAEYVDYFCSSFAHNTVLFENKGQERRDVFNHTRLTGKLFGGYCAENIKYVCADATGPMGRYFRRFLRHFVWIDDFILIYDDIEAYESGNVQFLIHEKNDGYFKMLSECSKEIRKGFKNYDQTETEDYSAYVKSCDSDCRAKFVSVLGRSCEDFSMLKEENVYTVTGSKWTVYINELSDGRIMHQNCINDMGGFETDAVLLAVNGNKIFFVNASFVRKDGKVIFSALERTTKITEEK